jgi:hypothetical protein
VPFANTQIATLKGLYGAVPDHICPDTRRARDNHILVNGSRVGPTRLGLLVALLGMVLEQYWWGTVLIDGMIAGAREAPPVTAGPEEWAVYHRRSASTFSARQLTRISGRDGALSGGRRGRRNAGAACTAVAMVFGWRRFGLLLARRRGEVAALPLSIHQAQTRTRRYNDCLGIHSSSSDTRLQLLRPRSRLKRRKPVGTDRKRRRILQR